jgi:hypothetical protein
LRKRERLPVEAKKKEVDSREARVSKKHRERAEVIIPLYNWAYVMDGQEQFGEIKAH